MRKIGIIFASFWLLTFCSPVVHAESAKKPISFDDFIRIKRVSDPQVSPQGDLIAFVVTEMDLAKNTSNSDIWIVPLSGGEPWRLTSSPKGDSRPRWSPDGKRIAFISSRSGSPQIWMIDPRGGEAFQVSTLSTGANGVIWSPTGEHLAFLSSVYPDCADDECNQKRNEEKAKSAVQAKMFHQLLFRHWNAWQDEKRSHLFVIPADGGKAIDVTPGDFDTPPISLGSTHDYTFSPDGKTICFVRNIDPELKISLGTNNDLFTTPIKGGTIQPITQNKANDNSPHYSPNGRYIAYRAMARPGFEADKYSLILVDWKNHKKLNLTEKLDISVNDILWSPDSSTLFITFQEKGRISLGRIALKGKKFEKILEGYFLSSPSLSPDGKTMVFLKQALHHPTDVYSLDLKTKKITPLTAMNKALLSKLEMNPTEEFWFDGAGGEKIHGFLVKPPFFDSSKKYPLVMLIHGGPQGAWSDNFHFRWNAQMFASPGYVTAMINFHGSTGYGQSFTDSITGDWGGKPYEDIMKGLDYLLSQYDFIDKDRLAAAGASYGGYMINWIEGHTTRFNCLISHAGVYDLRSMHGATEELWFPEWEFKGTPWSNKEMYEKWSPSFFVQNFKTPCLVIHGQYDFRVPVTQGFQLFTALQRMKVPSKMLYFPDENHFVQKPQNAELWWRTVQDWLAKYLR
ncbi:MAG: S9 family peptidase [Candidatus Aminicenantes bacterium]|jgi:dipeptidyl aminopeptidase/acylaminoacyl peptidase